MGHCKYNIEGTESQDISFQKANEGLKLHVLMSTKQHPRHFYVRVYGALSHNHQPFAFPRIPYSGSD